MGTTAELEALIVDQADDVTDDERDRVKGKPGRKPAYRKPFTKDAVRAASKDVAQPWEGKAAGAHPMLPLRPPGKR